MVNSSKITWNTIIFFVLLLIFFIIYKPSFMYSYKNKRFKSFGLAEGATIFTLPAIAISSIFIFFFIFLILELFIS